MPPRPVLLTIVILSALAWILWGFVYPIGVGVIHALLAVAAVGFVRWWALTH